MSKAIAVINQRGRKSTTAQLWERAYPRLLCAFIDLAQEPKLYAGLIQGYNAMGVLARPETAKEEIQHTPQGDIIASSPKLAGADKLLEETGKEYRLKEALDSLQGAYDYIIVDTPPALGILTINALTACTGAIIPAQADIYSLQGIAQLNSTIETVKKYCNPSLSIMGIVLTRFNGRSIIRREVAEMLERTAEQLHTKLYTSKIRECTALVEAQATKQNIYSYAPRSNATADYKALVAEILGEENKNNGTEKEL